MEVFGGPGARYPWRRLGCERGMLPCKRVYPAGLRSRAGPEALQLFFCAHVKET